MGLTSLLTPNRGPGNGTDMTRTYKLTITPNQAQTIIDALDLYSRVGMGQMEEVAHVARRTFGDKAWDFMRYLLREVHAILMGDYHTYYGILSHEVDERFRVAWDIQQVMRHRLVWDVCPDGGMSVSFQAPTKTSQEPLPTIAKDDGKYTLTISERQGDVLTWALDLFMRIGIGQVGEALTVADATFKKFDPKWHELRTVMESISYHLTGIRHGGPSITNKEVVNDVFRVACDLRDVIRHRLSWDRHPEGGWTVNFDKPWGWSESEPLATIEALESSGA